MNNKGTAGKTGTPQYSRTLTVKRTTSAPRVPVPVVQEGGEAGEARVDLLDCVVVPAGLELLAAIGTQPGAVRPAEWVHRLRQRELVVEHATQVDLVALVDAQSHVRIRRFGLELGAALE